MLHEKAGKLGMLNRGRYQVAQSWLNRHVARIQSLLLLTWVYDLDLSILKVTGIGPMTPVQTEVHLTMSEHKLLTFLVRKEIIENNNSLVVISLSKVGENEFLPNL